MQMPEGYKNVQVGDYVPVSPGGHKCIIQKVEEATSRSGNGMLIVYFDMDESDSQPAYFKAQYQKDKQQQGDKAKWRGVYYVTTAGDFGLTNLKRFTTAVEHSNKGFEVQWDMTPGDGRFVNCLRGRKVGFVFRQEEYLKKDGNVGRSVKPFRACDYGTATAQEAPKLKKLKGNSTASYSTQAEDSTMDGFMKIDHLDDAGLPFN